MRFHYNIFLFVCLAVKGFTATAQPKLYTGFKRSPVMIINFEQGLINNETNSVITDALGFTWISTRSGMQKFNGYTLETVNPVIGNDTIVINKPVFFYDAGDGAVGISYWGGLMQYDPIENKFTKITATTGDPHSFFSIVPLWQAGKERWWLQKDKGLVHFTGSKENIVFNDSTINAFLVSADVLSRNVIVHNKAFIFVRLADRKILCVNTQTKTARTIDDITENIVGLGIVTDKLYVSTNKWLYVYNTEDTNTVAKIPISRLFSEPLIFSCIQASNNGNILISNGNNLYEFDTAFLHRKQFTIPGGEPLVPTGSIHQLYTDKLKRIWLLTNNDIRVIGDREIPFAHFIYPGEKSNYTRSIFYDSTEHWLLAGCIDVGSGINGGLRLFDTLGLPLWPKPLVTAQMRNIDAIEKMGPRLYLITTFENGGWFLVNLANKSVSVVKMNIDQEIKQQLNSTVWPNNIQRINDSTILIACTANIFRCVFKKNQLQRAEPLLNKSAVSGNINCFIYSNDGCLWVGTNQGLIYILRRDGSLQTAQIPGGYAIRCFTESRGGHIWAGSDNGIFIYSLSAKLVKTIGKKSGMLNDYIYAMLPANGSESVFASTNMGLTLASLDGTVKNYTRQAGLQSNEFNTGAALRLPEGKLCFGGVNGINAFYPGDLLPLSDTPVINITRLLVNDSLYSYSASSWTGNSLTLNYPQNRIDFDIAAMGTLNTTEYNYAYRLKGLEKNWQTSNNPTGIRYHLEPGRYELEIQAGTLPGNSNPIGKKIIIMVYPAWWRSWWFATICFFLLSAVIVLIVWRYNLSRHKKNIQALELKQRIQEERERISRDLHDSMGAYAAAIAVNASKVRELYPEEPAPALVELQQNSRSIVTQLHDTIWALSREAIQLTAISDRFKLFLQKIQPSYPEISFTVKEEIINQQVFSPGHALHLFRIMQEAVNNAVKHSHCVEIITVIKSGVEWTVTISDNGNGMNTSDSMVAGNGLANIRSRAEEAGWNVEWVKTLPSGTAVIVQGKHSTNIN